MVWRSVTMKLPVAGDYGLVVSGFWFLDSGLWFAALGELSSGKPQSMNQNLPFFVVQLQESH